MILPPAIASLPPERIFAFDRTGVIATPAKFSPEVDILSIVVPNGWKCFIGEVAHGVSAGISEASGDLIWRVRIDKMYHPGYGEIKTTFGTFQLARSTYGIYANSRQILTYRVVNNDYNVAGTTTFACFKGVFYKP